MSTVGTAALKDDRCFTVADYLTWPDDERWELIHGIAWNMSAAPTRGHQKLAGALFGDLYQYLKDQTCEVYFAPLDVFLPDHEDQDITEADTVVQPDVVVVCDPSKLIDRGVRGAPDLVVEVLSPSTAAKDLENKKALYESHGVREYWIVRNDGSVFVWILKDRRFLPAVEYLPEMPVPSTVVQGFSWQARAKAPA